MIINQKESVLNKASFATVEALTDQEVMGSSIQEGQEFAKRGQMDAIKEQYFATNLFFLKIVPRPTKEVY